MYAVCYINILYAMVIHTRNLLMCTYHIEIIFYYQKIMIVIDINKLSLY